MVRAVNTKEREKQILSLIVDSYIEESRPISSGYLCQKYKLSCSSATIRNIMLALERQGLLSHIYTSSGRVPTKQGFKLYIQDFEYDNFQDYSVAFSFYLAPEPTLSDIVNNTLDALSLSGYTSLLAVSGQDKGLFFKGLRFMLEQPEFEDVDKLKEILYILEVKMNDIEKLLFNYGDDKIKILIGDDIGFSEIVDCSLVVSGIKEKDHSFALALLGPMRMNYTKAASCLYSVKNRLEELFDSRA